MKKIFILCFILLYQWVQAKSQDSQVQLSGNKCPQGLVSDSKGGCVPSPDQFCVDCVECVYTGRTIIITRSIQDDECGCEVVDSRCQAKIRCTPKPIGSGLHERRGITLYGQDGFGVNLPPFDTEVVCSLVNEKCPKDPEDCIKNDEVQISVEPGEKYRRKPHRLIPLKREQRSRPSPGRGIR